MSENQNRRATRAAAEQFIQQFQGQPYPASRKVYIEGALQTRKWTDQAGVEKYSTEIVLQRYRGELTLLDGIVEGALEAIEAGHVVVHLAQAGRTGKRGAGEGEEGGGSPPPPAETQEASSSRRWISCPTTPLCHKPM